MRKVQANKPTVQSRYFRTRKYRWRQRAGVDQRVYSIPHHGEGKPGGDAIFRLAR